MTAAVICAVLICSMILYAHVQNNSAWMRSASPDGDYRISIYAREGFGLLNVPTYLRIEARSQGNLFQRETIYARIDNDDRTVMPNYNAFILWAENNKAKIVLLGWEQYPEVISINFIGNRIEYERTSSAEAKRILNEFGVDVNALTSWIFPE